MSPLSHSGPDLRENSTKPAESSRRNVGKDEILEMLIAMKKEKEEREDKWEKHQRIREEFLEAEFRRKEQLLEQTLRQREEEWKEKMKKRENNLEKI